MTLNIHDFFEENFPWLIEVRRHIHKYPELSWQEYETTLYIQDKLHEIGLTDITKPLDTGVVALINPHLASNGCIALRADIDALPILEKRAHSYTSQNRGVMHACGHDVHTTCLLGAAKFLFANKDNIKHCIKLIFQPSEEKQPSGAQAMINAGVLDNPKVTKIFGLHVTPELQVGKLGFRKGAFMASADEIYITIQGKGGHAASPHLCIDPVSIGVQIYQALQLLVSRFTNPTTPTVISISSFQAGSGATNIIPNEAKLTGTLRTFDENHRKFLLQSIHELSNNIAKSYGAKVEVNIPDGIPFVYNDEALTQACFDVATEFVSSENTLWMPIRMGAEDFSYYGHHTSAVFFRLGTGNTDKNTEIPVHNENFDIDENALKIGAGFLSLLGLKG
ncbi:MAG: M20 family metallopeptidase [Cytophagaceae bacterium]|nr:M20 family metallopeptidase [Cytophagaceae bacterium]